MKKTNTLFLTFALAASLYFVTGCSKTEQTKSVDSATAQADAPKQGDGVGKIAGLDTALHTVTLSHNDVPGIMEAMTMEYTLEKPELAKGVAVGDSVKFTMKEPTTGTFLISAIQKLH